MSFETATLSYLLSTPANALVQHYPNVSSTPHTMYTQGQGIEMGSELEAAYNTTDVKQSVYVNDMVEYYVNGVLGMIVIFLGMVGNTLTVVVLTRKTMHSSTNCFLAALAVWDIVVLCGTLILITMPQLSVGYQQVVLPYIVVYFYPLALIAQTSTVWITVSFTVERYIAVCHPLKAASMCTINRARMVITGVSVFAFIYNLSRWFEYKLDDAQIQEDNHTITITSFGQTDFGADLMYKKVYFFYLYPFMMFIIPLSSLAVLNAFLIIAVKRSQKQQLNMNVRQSRENNVTIMLVSVVIVFMLCQVPALVYNVAYSIDFESVRSGFYWRILSSFRNFLVMLNSAVNFILYCAFGQKFRRIFMRTFCACFLSEQDFNSYTYHGTNAITTNRQLKGKYKQLLLKRSQHPNETLELSSNLTTHSILSRYSPKCKRSPSPQTRHLLAKYQNGRYSNQSNVKSDNGNKRISLENDADTPDKTSCSRLSRSSATPSPV